MDCFKPTVAGHGPEARQDSSNGSSDVNTPVSAVPSCAAFGRTTLRCISLMCLCNSSCAGAAGTGVVATAALGCSTQLRPST